MHPNRQAAVQAAIVSIIVSMALAGGVQAAESHDAHRHAPPAASAAPVQSGKMPGNAALRDGMTNVRSVMTANLAKRPGPSDYPRIAGLVEAEIDRITATCVLPADEDARLHLILARMIDGVGRMRTSDKPQVGVALILGALDEYGRSFEHPGWQPFGH